ncbi:recombination regulator RecX [Lentibacillus sp. L22]|uniref:recombination regulator RecX n=1 Tax=Lentibacillus TaxID=175304 RepID=UPI0022B10F3E|nr:recombination regulator RecX [Lentibacillus daqui]
MTKITRITTQKRQNSRYNIYIDNGDGEQYGFSVDEAVLIEYHLKKGLELDDAMITTLLKKDSFHKSYTLAINYLSYRMRTKKEMHDFLLKKEVDEEQISKILSRLEQEKLIDDKQFAESFVRTRINTTTKGPRLVQKELQEKGVAADIAGQAVTAYTYEIQYEKACKVVEKKLNQSSKHSFRQRLQQLQGNLLQKGFTQPIIKDVLDEMAEQKDDDAEWEALVHHGEKVMRKYGKKQSGQMLDQKVKEALFRKGFAIEQINRFLDEYSGGE